MADEIVKCPNCGFNIPISEVLTHQIRESLKTELEAGVKKRETTLLEREKQLSQSRASLDHQVAAKLKTEIGKIQVQEAKKVEDRIKVELEDLKSQVAEKEKRIVEAREAELELRKKTRDLEERKQAFELEMSRKMDAEREKLKQEALGKFAEEHRLKDAEKDKVINDLKQALDDAQRKAAQGSMQTQGEVQELDLEKYLKNAFPFDDILPVPKGIRGADVIQRVFDSTHKPCGIILWEAKHTRHWSDAWLQKLKDDQREIGADIAVIITEAMPGGVEHFSLREGVWVSRFTLAIGLATALRSHLVDVTFARIAVVGKSEKMEALYQYLSGPEFSQKIKAIGETFDMMQQQLLKEKRAMEKIWKEREKHIQRIA
ncbi:MAG: DUF2130 domain-containing protein, partial [Dehalococcoidia bacterium]